MEDHGLTDEKWEAFGEYLKENEYGAATIEKYLRELRGFKQWLDGRTVSKETAAEYKAHLQKEGYAPVTVNAKLSALNVFFRFAGWEECRVRFLRIQRQLFRNQSKELTREEIFLSEKLCRKLLKYIKKQEITSGEIFLTGNGKGLSRRQIWREMKGLCESAGVEATKVFPHNLRHLFATVYYKVSRDIVKLADVLGHSSIETTRIYLKTTGKEHTRHLEKMGLVV
ncbi:MAG: tyrosine-type recombinase/integrase [Lachnospiraceae bacterium]|nr:tyrosine-type recombinase/integrase [Lachnospiraceae bacterium]